MIELYYFYPACSLASHLALEESGLPYMPVRVDLKDPAKAAEYKKINPRGTVPLLIHNGVQLLETVAILDYVDRLAPGAKLMPADPMARAQCMSFLAWGTSTAHINFRMSFRPERFGAPAEMHDAMKALGRTNFWASLQTLNERLAKQDWIMGKDFSAADCYALRFYDWGRIAKYPVEELAAFTAHKDRMIARPAVRRVLEREACPLIQLAAAQ